MPQPLKLLIVEDNPPDAELELVELRRAGFEPDWRRVDTEAAYLEQLNSGLDLVLSDFQMPQFNGLRALELLKQSGLDIPFILVSGTIGEDTAVAAIKHGATDYLLKDRLARLGPAVTHALMEARLRRERGKAEVTTQRQLSELRVLFDLIPAMIWFKDTEDRILRVNQRVAEAAGKSIEEIEGKTAEAIYPQEAVAFHRDDLEVIRLGVPKLGQVETRRDPAGQAYWIQTDKVPVRDKAGKVIGIVVMRQDISARKRADEALRESEERFSESFAHAPSGVALVAPDGRWLLVNRALCDLLGYTEAELRSRTFQDITHPEDLAIDLENVRRLLAGEIRTYQMEKRYIKATGQVVPVLLYVSLVRDGSGRPSYFISHIQDITARKQTEVTLHREQALLNSLISTIPDHIYIKDRQSRFIRINDSMAQRIGLRDPKEAIGKSDMEYFTAEHAQSAYLQEQDIMATGVSIISLEEKETWADGSVTWASTTKVPLRNTAGEIVGLIGVTRDITERRAVMEVLRESELRFKAMFEQAAVGVALTDAATGRFVQVNQRFCDIAGRSREELEQLTYAAITHPQDVGRHLESMQQLKAGSLREYSREKRYLRPDGSVMWVFLTVSAMWAPGETPGLCIAIVQDITESKQVEDHLLQAQKMEALGQFSGGVAHDFNNILSAIGGYTELARMQLEGNPKVREHLGAVIKATNRAADLVRQILTFSRQQPQTRTMLLLQPVVVESMKLMRATIPTTVEIAAVIAADAPTVLANANQVHQVLMNLAINGWHALKNHPGRLQVKLEKVTVDTAFAVANPGLRPGCYARLSVSDTGCGMDPATLRRIFEPFFTTKPVGEGTGLGLAVVHGIMDSHDGAVTVHSQPGEGTVFGLYFPEHTGETIPTPGETGPTPHGQGERVLVVDDEEMLAEMGANLLTRLGYTAESTTTSAQALAMVRADRSRFALVLTDQTMPGMTGLQLASQLRDIRPNLPIMLMTGYNLSLTADRVGASGIRNILHKPFTMHSLGTAVHATLIGTAFHDHGTNSPY